MGIYKRPDSPFWYLLLERGRHQKPIRKPTRIPVDGGSPEQTHINERAAQVIYSQYMLRLALDDAPVFVEPIIQRRKGNGRHLYFIQCGDRVKIGRSNNVHNRLRDLNVKSGEQLILLASIKEGGRLERDYHKRFHDARLNGEWFQLTAELRAAIETITTGAPDHQISAPDRAQECAL